MIIEPPRRRSLQLQLTPLIDVVFLILTFFIVFTVFRGTESAIGLRLPRATTSEQHPPAPLVVTIPATGGFYVNGRPVDQRALGAEVARVVEQNPEQLVILKADRNVRYERLVEALDAVRENGGTRLALAVEPKPRPDAAIR
ncbi:MAG: biopolymer transporter ExbD [Bacillota bacterium]|nr:biopolymer transporter ExbD [Bacillota bacterium]